MNAKEVKFGNVSVLVLPTDVGTGQATGTIKTVSTQRACPSFTDIVRDLATGLSDELKRITEKGPSEIEIEMKLGLTEKTNFWVINVGGEQSITVKMKWIPLQ